MSLADWFPSLSTAGVIAAALWLSRNLIATRLTKAVQFEFDEKLEGVRAEGRRHRDETLRAELREKEAEIAALRSGALSAISSRQIALDKRRMQAAEEIWATVLSLSSSRAIASYMSVISFEKAAKETRDNPRARELFDMIGTGAGFKASDADHSSAKRARPLPLLNPTR